MTVYVIQAGPDGPVKIGHCKDAWRRRENLQIGSPFPLYLRGTLPGGAAEEKILHDKFRHLRVRGEWFDLDPSAIEGLRPFCHKRRNSSGETAATALIDALGGNAEVATLCGTHPATVSNWRTRGLPLWTHSTLKGACDEREVDHDPRLFEVRPRTLSRGVAAE